MAAQSEQRVLFIDGDFWRSGAGAALGIRSGAGLAELLEGKAKLSEVVVSDVTSGADIILSGKFSRASLVAWIGKLPELLDSLKNQYDVIIIDAPPILAVSEAALLACHADATVMAIRWASTPWDAGKIALKKLKDGGASVTGAVLTMVRESDHAKYCYPNAAFYSKYLSAYRPPTGAIISATPQPLPDKRNASPRLKTFGRESDGSRQALLVLDIQETFTFSPRRDSQSSEAYDRLLESINGLSQIAFKSDIMVLYGHRERANPLARSPSRFVVKKVDGNGQTSEHLKLVPGYRFIKPGKDAFSNVELDQFLRKNGITHLFLVGSDGVTSINRTARSALDLGYRVTFIKDGIFTSFASRWERVLRTFESEAAFAIASEEFAEFAVAVRQASETRRRSHERDLANRFVAQVTR
jgi:nicotinamidase-related amidase